MHYLINTILHREADCCVMQVIIALLFGYMISAVITTDGNKYIQASQFKPAPSITFLWVKTFGFGFYAPAVLPFLIGKQMRCVYITVVFERMTCTSAPASGLHATCLWLE